MCVNTNQDVLDARKNVTVALARVNSCSKLVTYSNVNFLLNNSAQMNTKPNNNATNTSLCLLFCRNALDKINWA